MSTSSTSGCVECGPFGVAGYVPSTIPAGHPDNPYNYPHDVWLHCRTCNGVRAEVHGAGRDPAVCDHDGWPTDWQGPKVATAVQPSSRGRPSGHGGPINPLPPEFARMKWATGELGRLMGRSDDEAIRQRATLGRILARLADRIDARVAAAGASNGHVERSGVYGELGGGRGHLRPVP